MESSQPSVCGLLTHGAKASAGSSAHLGEVEQAKLHLSVAPVCILPVKERHLSAEEDPPAWSPTEKLALGRLFPALIAQLPLMVWLERPLVSDLLFRVLQRPPWFLVQDLYVIWSHTSLNSCSRSICGRLGNTVYWWWAEAISMTQVVAYEQVYFGLNRTFAAESVLPTHLEPPAG